MTIKMRLKEMSLGILVLMIVIPMLLAAQAISYVKIEAESGALSSASSITDATASGGAYIRFDTTSGTTPPSGMQFEAKFETPGDFYNRFVFHTGNYRTNSGLRPEYANEPDAVYDWNGDHNMACEGPTTLRNVNVENHNEFFWWCAPGGDATKGHIMTGISTNSYVIASFSPNQTFTNVNKICWDINNTDLGGGKWTNAIVVPESVYLSNPNTDQEGRAEGEGPYRLDYVTPGFNDDNGPGDFNLQRFDVWGFRTFRSQLTLFWRDNEFWQSYNGEFNLDKAARYQKCIQDNNNGTVTLTIKNPSGVISTYSANSNIPDGKVRIIFQDDNYNPPKRDGYNINNNTWHWDNIQVF